MATIQWRPEVNVLTIPQSYRILFLPRNIAGREDIAADIARQHPHFSEADILTILNAEDQAIQTRLLNGEQVTKSGAFSYSLTFTGKLNKPDDPLPPLDQCLHVNVRVSPPFIDALRYAAQTERLPMEKKLPLISTAQDTVLKLKDVLNPAGLLLLTGEDMHFDSTQEGASCVLENTAGGTITQTRFGKIEDSELIIMPDIPARPQPWNNEYTVSISTYYSEHGTLRTGTYGRMLRAPLTISQVNHPNPQGIGILTGNAASPYVSIIGGSVTAEETVRIQAVFDARADVLLFRLLDMEEGGAVGTAVTVTANGEQTLLGFSGSAVSSLNIRINDYTALKEMIRSHYSGRLIDVLEIETA